MTTAPRALLPVVVAALLVGCTTPPPTSAPAPDEPAVVVTDAGTVRGAVEGQHRRFSGIP